MYFMLHSMSNNHDTGIIPNVGKSVWLVSQEIKLINNFDHSITHSVFCKYMLTEVLSGMIYI